MEQRRRMMEEKLLHAELKRELQLQAIVKKAQEEEAKVEEGKCSVCVTDEGFSELSWTFAVVLFLLPSVVLHSNMLEGLILAKILFLIL